ncbi:MAG: (2Fe-2S) ferredoxin domain-containing protein [Pirellulaceae bacterium]
MPAFTHHIFICGNQRPPGHPRDCCDPDGSERLKSLFKDELKRHGLKSQVRANSAGCLDQCELGPAVVIYPQGIWYGRVRPEDVPRIVRQTIIGGETLPDLLIPDQLLNTKQGWPAAEQPVNQEQQDG